MSIDTPKALIALTAEATGRAVRAGEYAPAFRLRDLHGGTTALIDLIEHQPLVITFYRGLWCSFCDTALVALSRIDDEIRALGAHHVAIVPPPGSEDQLRRLETFPMPVLLDRGLRVCSAFGLTISLPADLREPYSEAGYTPPGGPRGGEWRVPIPATYVVGRGGRIVLAATDFDYRHRLAPARLLAVLRGLQRRLPVQDPIIGHSDLE